MDEKVMRDMSALDITGREATERDSGVRERPRADLSDNPTLTGERFGPYEVLEALGSGAMGHIYRARHVVLDRMVAIKVLRPELIDEEVHLERFVSEARAVNLLRHPNVIDVMDIGLGDGPAPTPWFVMELLDGVDVAGLLAETRIDVLRALYITRQVCEALEAIHAAGIVHRDIKPENIFITQRDGRDFVKLIDFGVARLRQSRFAQPNGGKDNLIGTPRYMAPEQIGDHPIDHRADLYAVGAVLFEMLSGTPPLDADDLVDLLRRVMVKRPPRLSSCVTLPLAVRGDLDHLVAWCLEKRPSDRPGSARELIQNIDDIAARLITPVALAHRPAQSLDDDFVPGVPRRSSALPFVAGVALSVIGLGAGAWVAVDQTAPHPFTVQAAPVVAPAAGEIEPTVEETAVAALDLPLETPLVETPVEESPVLVGVDTPTSLDSSDERRERRRARRRERAELEEAEPILTVTAAPELAERPLAERPLAERPLAERLRAEPRPRAEPLDRDGVLNPFQ